jgi:hypothetical protein
MRNQMILVGSGIWALVAGCSRGEPTPARAESFPAQVEAAQADAAQVEAPQPAQVEAPQPAQAQAPQADSQPAQAIQAYAPQQTPLGYAQQQTPCVCPPLQVAPAPVVRQTVPIVQPPQLVFEEQPTLVAVDPGVYVVQNYDLPVYYIDGTYWRGGGGGVWYSAPHWDAPWVVVQFAAVPRRISIRDSSRYVHYRAPSGAHVHRDERPRVRPVPPRPPPAAWPPTRRDVGHSPPAVLPPHRPAVAPKPPERGPIARPKPPERGPPIARPKPPERGPIARPKPPEHGPPIARPKPPVRVAPKPPVVAPKPPVLAPKPPARGEARPPVVERRPSAKPVPKPPVRPQRPDD